MYLIKRTKYNYGLEVLCVQLNGWAFITSKGSRDVDLTPVVLSTEK